MSANMSSGAMPGLLAITAVTTAIIRTAIIGTAAIDPGRGRSRGAMAGSGAGERRIATDTNRPSTDMPIDMRSRG